MKRYEVRVLGPDLNKEDKVRAETVGGATAKAFMKYPDARTVIVTFRGKKLEFTNPRFEARKVKLGDKSGTVHEHVIPEGGMPEASCPACEAGLPVRPTAKETGHHDEKLITGEVGV
jgi:hypothetical protein